MRAYGPAAAVLLAAVTASAPAATVCVDPWDPACHETIQEGIDAAAPGDTVLVAPGIYSGPMNIELSFEAKDIRLLAEAGPGTVTIDCQREGRGFVFGGGETTSAAVEGFVVRNGSADEGGAARIRSSAVGFLDCVFEDNSAAYGGAVYLGPDAWSRFERCSFSGNHADNHGGAVYAYLAHPYLLSCEFTDNSADFTGGAVSCKKEVVARIRDCVFRGNAGGDGGAIYIGTGGTSTWYNLVDRCWIIGNTAERGGGIFLNSMTWARVEQSTLVGNSATEGGGVFCHTDMWGALQVRTCTLVANAGLCGGGICVEGMSYDNQLDVLNTIVAFSTQGKAQHCLSAVRIYTDLSLAYGNAGGDVLYGVSDRILYGDPLFCDLYGGDYNLCENSVCLDSVNEWGEQVGSHTGSCAPCTSPVSPASWGAIKAMYR